jgi:DNA-binding transcriptional ArsR family regulator
MMAGVPRTATTADAFDAIAEANRRDVLDALGDDEVTVNDLVARLRMSQPQVSKHLGVLREVGIVRVRAEGRHRYYRVYGPALKPIHAWVQRFEQSWNERLDRLDDLVQSLSREEQKEEQ